MSEKISPGEVEFNSRRTESLRKQAIGKFFLFRSFIAEHPEINLDDDADMTDEQEAAWVAYSTETLAYLQDD